MPAKYLVSKSISCNVTNLSLAHEEVLHDIFWGTQQHQSSTVVVASAENTYLLQSRLKDILIDASGCCEYIGYVDQDGYVRVKIECIVSGQEKQQNWDQLTKLPI